MCVCVFPFRPALPAPRRVPSLPRVASRGLARCSEGKMSSYDKKKYVCKMLYMYILGWEVDFGHVEAVNLIAGNKYTEKQIVRPAARAGVDDRPWR